LQTPRNFKESFGMIDFDYDEESMTLNQIGLDGLIASSIKIYKKELRND